MSQQVTAQGFFTETVTCIHNLIAALKMYSSADTTFCFAVFFFLFVWVVWGFFLQFLNTVTLQFRSPFYWQSYNIPVPINNKFTCSFIFFLSSQQDQSSARNYGSTTICHEQAGRTKGILPEGMCVNVLVCWATSE